MDHSSINVTDLEALLDGERNRELPREAASLDNQESAHLEARRSFGPRDRLNRPRFS